MEIVHLIPPDIEEKLKCKYCIMTCSDSDILQKHMKTDQKSKCKKYFKTFKNYHKKEDTYEKSSS